MKGVASGPSWAITLAWLILTASLVAAMGACEQAQELTPVVGRLTNLDGEAPPPGWISGDIPEAYKGRVNPFTLQDADALARGQRIYVTAGGDLACFACHGHFGRGDGPRALYMDPRPADFAAPSMRDAFRYHQDYVFWWVSEGVERTPMPAYRNVLSEVELWEVITYSWHLSEQATAPESPER